MSLSSQHPSSWATHDWDVLVAQEVARQRAIDAAFDRADECELDGDVQLALEWLERASELSGGLSEACLGQRARLVSKLETGNR